MLRNSKMLENFKKTENEVCRQSRTYLHGVHVLQVDEGQQHDEQGQRGGHGEQQQHGEQGLHGGHAHRQGQLLGEQVGGEGMQVLHGEQGGQDELEHGTC